MRIRWQLVVALVFFCALAIHALRHDSHPHMGNQSADDPDWSELTSSMEKMHAAMAAVEPSGATDVDFVRLMLPHHRAALDMAKTQLLYGNDPQMRRLAQEILTDQTIGDSVDAALAITARSAKMTPALKGTRRTNMKIVRWCQMFCLLSASAAQQAPWGRPDITVSSHDRDRFTAPHFALNG